jgi:hypothetical protein
LHRIDKTSIFFASFKNLSKNFLPWKFIGLAASKLASNFPLKIKADD